MNDVVLDVSCLRAFVSDVSRFPCGVGGVGVAVWLQRKGASGLIKGGWSCKQTVLVKVETRKRGYVKWRRRKRRDG